MNHFCLAGFLVTILAIGMPLSPVAAQMGAVADPKQAAVERNQAIIREHLIETQRFQVGMPLADFLDALERQLPERQKVKLRLDKAAFGAGLAKIAATPIALWPNPKRISLADALGAALSKSKTKIDYRVGPDGVMLTTPRKALYTIGYAIRDIVERPGLGSGAARTAGTVAEILSAPAVGAGPRAEQIVRAIVAGTGPQNGKIETDLTSIEVLNNTRLVIRASGTRHASIAQMLQAFRHIADVTVVAQAKLYEVDDAFYAKVKGLKRVSLEEAEQMHLKGILLEEDFLLIDIKKYILVQPGDEARVVNAKDIALLSRRSVNFCLPGREQAFRGESARQTILHGVAFRAGVQVSSDRRFVRLDLTEEGTEIQKIQKVKGWDAGGKEVEYEIPLLKKATHCQILEIADGGSIPVAVHYRPQEVRAKDRWWVLVIGVRILIEEEERQLRQRTLLERKEFNSVVSTKTDGTALLEQTLSTSASSASASRGKASTSGRLSK
jgi:hypothetical protein